VIKVAIYPGNAHYGSNCDKIVRIDMPVEIEMLHKIPYFSALSSEDLSLRHVTARMAKILLDREISAQQDQHTHRLTQTEMAALVGSTREVVGRAK
jgi:hypothetical protein